MLVEQLFPHHDGAKILADVDGDDRRLGLPDLEAHLLQLFAHVGEVLAELIDAPGLLLHDLEGGHGGGDRRGRGARREHERAGEVLDVVEHLALADEPAADGGERLGKRAAHEVDLVADAEMRGGAAAARADDAERVRVVDEHARAVLLDDFDELGKARNLPFGAEDAVGDDERAFVGIELRKRAVERLGVVVLVAHHPRADGLTEAHAVVDRRVNVAVDDGDALLVGKERRDGGEVDLVAGGEDQRRFLAEKRGQLFFELVVQLHRAVDEPRAGHARAELVDRVARRFAHPRVRRQAEVVVRAEHDHAAPFEHRFGSVVQIERAEERIDAHLARVVRGTKLIGLFEDVTSADGGQRCAGRHRCGELLPVRRRVAGVHSRMSVTVGVRCRCHCPSRKVRKPCRRYRRSRPAEFAPRYRHRRGWKDRWREARGRRSGAATLRSLSLRRRERGFSHP